MHIARDNGMFWTNDDARRLEAHLCAMGAIVALRGSMTVWINVKRVIGTRLHARLAANTTIGVKVNNAVRPFVQRLRRADSDARRVGAMIAAAYEKIAARIGKLTFLNVLNPCSINTDRRVMLRLARHGAGMAADTLALVDNEGVFRHELFLLSSSTPDAHKGRPYMSAFPLPAIEDGLPGRAIVLLLLVYRKSWQGATLPRFSRNRNKAGRAVTW